MRLIKEKDEIQDCSFKPKTNKSQISRLQNKKVKEAADNKENDKEFRVYDYLYQKAKPKATPKSTLEIEYEKQKEECTFKPTINTDYNKGYVT